MKNLIFFTSLIFLFFSCQSNSGITPVDSTIKAEKFETGMKTNSGIDYIASEANHPNYSPRFLAEAVRLSFKYKNQPWQEGANALNSLMEKIVDAESRELDLVSRVDLQIITYINFDRFIFKAGNSLEQQRYAFRNLKLLMDNTQPLEWKIMAKSLILSKPILAPDKYDSIQKYIVSGAQNTLKNPESVIEDNDVRAINHLKIQAKMALELLASNN